MQKAKHVTFIVSLLLLTVSGSHSQPETNTELQARPTAIRTSMLLKVTDQTRAGDKIAKLAFEHGGFFTELEDAKITLKVPPSSLETVLGQISEHGTVLEKDFSRVDLTQETARLEALLRSKEEILQHLKALFADANLSSTLDIERNMTGLVIEIEQTKGRLRVVREDAKYAVIVIALQVADRHRYIYVQSPFEWLNTVNLQRFLGEF